MLASSGGKMLEQKYCCHGTAFVSIDCATDIKNEMWGSGSNPIILVHAPVSVSFCSAALVPYG